MNASQQGVAVGVPLVTPLSFNPAAFNPAETYAIQANGSIHRGSDGAFIPTDPANADYQAYRAWVEAGGTPQPAPAPAEPTPAVPDQIAIWQARATVQKHGLLEAATAAVQASGDPALSAVWDYGNYVSRASPGIAALAAALDLDASAVDALFIEAAALTA